MVAIVPVAKDRILQDTPLTITGGDRGRRQLPLLLDVFLGRQTVHAVP